MFDVSFTELLVVGVVALVVIGPERLPKVARTLGHLVGRAQRYVSDVKSDIQREVELDELRKLKDQMQDAAQSVQSSLQSTSDAFSKPLETLEQNTMSTFNEATAGLKQATSFSTPSSEPVAKAASDSPALLDAAGNPNISFNAVPSVSTPVASGESAVMTPEAALANASQTQGMTGLFDTPVQAEFDIASTSDFESAARKAQEAEKALASAPTSATPPSGSKS
jgi:sec-independent protein translocase protein TatB